MKGKHLEKEITPTLSSRFECKTDHYLLPFEKADRYVIRLSTRYES
jgi:hypothetical protein